MKIQERTTVYTGTSSSYNDVIKALKQYLNGYDIIIEPTYKTGYYNIGIYSISYMIDFKGTLTLTRENSYETIIDIEIERDSNWLFWIGIVFSILFTHGILLLLLFGVRYMDSSNLNDMIYNIPETLITS